MRRTGEGKQATANGTTAIWTPSAAGNNGISVYVTGAAAVYALVNCTTAEFDVAYAANSTIRVWPGVPYNFNGDKVQNITCICYRTATGDSVVDFAAF